jgi:DNA-binding beta-propeller fold protein YncE
VTLINGRTNKIIGTYRDGVNQYDSGGISVNPRTGTMYATNNAGKTVEISGRTGKAIGTLPFGLPIVSPRTGDLYVTNEPVNYIGASTIVVYAP